MMPALPEHPELASNPTTAISPTMMGALVFLVGLVVLVAMSWNGVSRPIYEDGDFAANAILIDEAISLDLLHGNYSRAGFYHPGPAFLYVQAGSQVVLHELLRLVPTPYNAHLSGILLLNASILALLGRILYRHTGSLWSVGLMVVVAFAYSLAFHTPGLGGLLVSTWMPHIYVLPFLLLLVSSASVVAGHGEDLWVFALAAGLLAHGHVSFLLPVAAFTGFVFISWAGSHRHGWFQAIPKRTRVGTGLILIVFGLPMLLQVLTDFPGQFGAYVSYVREADIPARGFGEVAKFLAQYWGFSAAGPILIPLLAITALASSLEAEPDPKRLFLLALLWACALASATTALYALTGVDDINQTYLGLFYVAVPTLIWVALGTKILDQLGGARGWLSAGLASLLFAGWLFVVLQPNSGSLYGGSDVGRAYDTIDNMVDESSPIAFTLAEHNDWIATIGILEQARRGGRMACAQIGAGIFEIVFTEQAVCDDASAGYTQLLVTSRTEQPTPTASLLYENDVLRVWEVDD